MPIHSVTTAQYKNYLLNAPETPLWQSLEWKAYQESLGRQTRVYGHFGVSGDLMATALVIVDSTTLGLSTWDIPRGPLGTSQEAIQELLEGIVEEAKRERCMALYCSPQEAISYQLSAISSRHEQPEATIMLDLTLSDAELLKQMKEKGRYNIRLAKKRGVIVKQSDDIDAYYELLKKTGGRDQFKIKPKHHYQKFLETLPGAFLFLAYPPSPSPSPNPNPIAGLLGTTHASTGIYYYGASDYAHRALMAPYLLQWKAMQHCRSLGCDWYDLFGIAPEAMSGERLAVSKHPWAGVTRFKKQFGGEIVTYPAEREIMLRPLAKRLLGWKRGLLG